MMERRELAVGAKWRCWRAILASLLVCVLGAGAVGFPVIVHDDRGMEIEFSAPPERVVVLSALYGEILVDLGAAELIVGVADSPDNPGELRDLPAVGPSFSPSVENIIALQPDLVLGAWGDVRARLEDAGFRVLTAGQEGGFIAAISDIFATIRTVGTAVGRGHLANTLVGEIATEIVLVESAVLERERVAAAFLFMGAPDTPPYAIGRASVENELLLRAGGENVFADVLGFPQVSLEEVLARDPEVIFTDPTQVENVMESRQLREVTAIREGRVYEIGAAETTSTRVARALRELARWLHPEAFEED